MSEETNDIYSPFNLHLLFDYYSGDVGSTRKVALSEFIKTTSLLNKPYDAMVKNIFNSALLLESSITLFESIYKEFREVHSYDNDKKRHRWYQEFDVNLIKLMINVSSFDKERDIRLRNNYEALIYYGHYFYDNVINLLNAHKEVFILTGYSNSQGGHMITFYIQSNLEDDRYKLVIVNSGDGIDYHKKINDQIYQCIVEKYVTKDMLLELCIHVIIMRCLILTSGHGSTAYDNVLNSRTFYNVMQDIFNNNKPYSTLLKTDESNNENNDLRIMMEKYAHILPPIQNIQDVKEIEAEDVKEEIQRPNPKPNPNQSQVLQSVNNSLDYYVAAQISSSCTFYSMYYFIYYIIIKHTQNKAVFYEWSAALKCLQLNKIINYFNVKQNLNLEEYTLYCTTIAHIKQFHLSIGKFFRNIAPIINKMQKTKESLQETFYMVEQSVVKEDAIENVITPEIIDEYPGILSLVNRFELNDIINRCSSENNNYNIHVEKYKQENFLAKINNTVKRYIDNIDHEQDTKVMYVGLRDPTFMFRSEEPGAEYIPFDLMMSGENKYEVSTRYGVDQTSEEHKLNSLQQLYINDESKLSSMNAKDIIDILSHYQKILIECNIKNHLETFVIAMHCIKYFKFLFDRILDVSITNDNVILNRLTNLVFEVSIIIFL
jgi:hypothetical protein